MALASWWAVSVAVVALVAYRIVTPRLRLWVLLLASIGFYAPAGVRDVLVTSGLALFTWVAGRAIAARPTRGRLALGVAGVLAVLTGFKYLPMAAETANVLLRLAGSNVAVPVPQVTLPLGLSFVSFALIHFLVETYRGSAVPDVVRFSLYTFFFPTVTLGPIKRYPEFIADTESVAGAGEALPGRSDVGEGLWGILRGLVRKFVIADTVAVLVPYMTEPGGSRAMALVGIAAFSLRIYFDFAGYSDIAIGTARLFGFHILENFDRPYLQRNISDFWKHWHISLTRFITEYVFIPLGGSRASVWRVALNTMIAMGLSGLWHGAGWNFVVWGLYHGAGLVVLRWWKKGVKALRDRSPAFDRAVSARPVSAIGHTSAWLLTLSFVWLGWVLFALPIESAAAVYAKLLGLPPGTGAGLLRLLGGAV
ncbi:MAG: MBOAT family O-acyltransferase [Coriobacteriia bacterium]